MPGPGHLLLLLREERLLALALRLLPLALGLLLLRLELLALGLLMRLAVLLLRPLEAVPRLLLAEDPRLLPLEAEPRLLVLLREDDEPDFEEGEELRDAIDCSWVGWNPGLRFLASLRPTG